MYMKISELIGVLQNMQSLGGDVNTNVSAVRLKAEPSIQYEDAGYGYVRNKGKREITRSLWVESFSDWPAPSQNVVESMCCGVVTGSTVTGAP
jgi:hypothetical protein